jgi:hypothetical protein
LMSAPSSSPRTIIDRMVRMNPVMRAGNLLGVAPEAPGRGQRGDQLSRSLKLS